MQTFFNILKVPIILKTLLWSIDIIFTAIILRTTIKP